MTSIPTSSHPADGSSSLPAHRAASAEPAVEPDHRPAAIRHISAPPYQSPLHHRERRYVPRRHPVKVTHDAHSEYGNSQDDGTAEHRINQYVISQEIGRGSFGSVHMAVDQFGKEFAVKEFSKARLRKRAQSNMLRRHPFRGGRGARQGPFGGGFNIPLAREGSQGEGSSVGANHDPFELIKEEIAIMKKLDHPNVVQLVEVLDDPSEDLLFMVMEMCKKGVVMKVGLEQKAEPYDMERCRLWFRDLVLGIEYLHAQGIVHRDIKPDNCLITNEDVLKIVDFGVSEMFNNESEMTTKKSAGSPAFMPPELCVPKHGEVSGRPVDVWSMGVTLYCLAFGCIPFEKVGMLELFESIKNDEPHIPSDCDPNFKDLLIRLLEKDPNKRIEMDEIREHPWVTLNGQDNLLPKEENIIHLVAPPTQEEVNRAITAPIRRMVYVIKAATKFKRLIGHKRPDFFHGEFGPNAIVQAPDSYNEEPENERESFLSRMKTDNSSDRKPIEGNLTTEGIIREITVSDDLKTLHSTHSTDKIDIRHKAPIVSKGQWGPILKGAKPHMPFHAEPQKDVNEKGSSALSPLSSRDQNNHETDSRPSLLASQASSNLPSSSNRVASPEQMSPSRVASPMSDHGKGQAHDPLEDTLFLNIGSSADGPLPNPEDLPVVSESPSAVVEADVYEKAYEEEIQKILAAKKREGNRPTLFLTKRVEGVARLRDHDDITNYERMKSKPKLGFAALAEKAKELAGMEKKESDSAGVDGTAGEETKAPVSVKEDSEKDVSVGGKE